MKIGFTGTQEGTTKEQYNTTSLLIKSCLGTDGEFHVGDCIGSDQEMGLEAYRYGYRMMGHPPINRSKRAFLYYDFTYDAKPYLERNHDIVDAVDYMLATPKEFTEQLRSGTWSTIRYAKKMKKPLTIIYPDGSIEEFNCI